MIRAAILAALLAAPAAAQEVCGPTWQVRGDLRGLPWQEAPLIALVPDGATDGARLELWVNLDTETWTMIAVGSQGVACVITYGDGLDPFAMREAG